LFSCANPFAPSLDDEPVSGDYLISDQKDIAGVFQNFKYAYTFRDTTIYGDLLDQDFTFAYTDYEQGFDKSWGRSEEMRATEGLFRNSQNLDLIWNNIILISSDSTNIIRSFNLTITFNPADIVQITGRVNLTLIKNPATLKWKILRWFDESNY